MSKWMRPIEAHEIFKSAWLKSWTKNIRLIFRLSYFLQILPLASDIKALSFWSKKLIIFHKKNFKFTKDIDFNPCHVQLHIKMFSHSGMENCFKSLFRGLQKYFLGKMAVYSYSKDGTLNVPTAAVNYASTKWVENILFLFQYCTKH